MDRILRTNRGEEWRKYEPAAPKLGFGVSVLDNSIHLMIKSGTMVMGNEVLQRRAWIGSVALKLWSAY